MIEEETQKNLKPSENSFKFNKKRETGFEPATPTLARLYSTPEPLAQKRVMGIEPTYPAWKAGVLPLNYTRKSYEVLLLTIMYSI